MIKIQKIRDFFQHEVWTTDLEAVSRVRRFVVRAAQMLILSVRGFKDDKLTVNASALTYFTMLSIVPVLALGFGIAKGFGLEAVLEDEIAQNFAGQEQAKEYILQFTKSMLDTTRGGLVAGIGIVLLLWSVVKLLSNIEAAFNTVWEVKKGRPVLRKFTDYTSIVMLGPIIMILSSSITIFISSQFATLGKEGGIAFVTPVALTFAKILPFVLIWMLFTLLYLVIPNTRVRFRSALIAGIVAGTAFQVFQSLYVEIQSSFTRLNAIYGSFAALPLFLIWLQTSWIFILLGAEISFVLQNLKLKSSTMSQEQLSIRYQKKVALYLMKKIIDRFKSGNTALNLTELANQTRLPIYTVERVLEKMLDAGIVVKVMYDENSIGYHPAETIENLTIAKVIDAYETTGKDESKFIVQDDFDALQNAVEILNKLKHNVPENVLIKTL